MKKIILLAFVVGLLSTAAFVGFVRPAVAEGTIYIRSDGSVDPEVAPIQRIGNIYIFTENIYASFVVERDNVAVDGAGYTLQGTGNVKGIDLSHRSNVTIKNMQITGAFLYGIYLQNSSNNNITQNIIANTMRGIYLQLSSNNRISANHIINNLQGGILIKDSSNTNTISANNVINNGGGISIYSSSNNKLRNNNMINDFNLEVYGTELSHFVNDVDVSNIINGKKVYFLVNESDLIISPSTFPSLGFLALVNCTRIIVQNLNLANNGQGILLAFTRNSTITKNNLTNNVFGIRLDVSSNHNSICGNEITNNSNGIWLSGSSNNTISGNNITDNMQGFYLFASSNNTIYHNNFTSNSKQVYDSGGESLVTASVNKWDNGYPSGGNYWSDYTGLDLKSGPNQDQPGSDCIGDSSYNINGNNKDNYPLVPYSNALVISTVSPENKTYTVSNVSLTFTVNEPPSWIGYSLDGQANVTITENTTLIKLSDGSHSLRIYARDTAGNIGTSETIYFSIAQKTGPRQSEPFPKWIAAIIAIEAASAAALLFHFVKVRKTTEKAE